MTPSTSIAVHRSITVQAPPERAWTVFTERMGAWWPGDTHHVGDEPGEAMLESREGGRWYERGRETGAECDWGYVIAWDPPRRLVLAWQLDPDFRYDPDPARVTEVEVRFLPEGDATRVELTHSGFERHGDASEKIRDAIDSPGGWSDLLALYVAEVRAA
jgi:uncharacterized protein YndB with AHSA1/START domain